MRFLVFILFVIGMIGCTPKDLPTVINTSNDKIEVKLSYMSTKTELDSLKEELKIKYNIDFQFEGSRFFENGNLRDLNIKLVLPNGSGGKASALLATLETKYFGFEIDLTQQSKKPFRIGSIF